MRKYKILGHVVYFLSKPIQWFFLKHRPPRAYVQIEHKSQILLVRNWLGSGKWSYPGGGVHKNEDPKVGACRELFEEISLKVKPDDLEKVTSGLTRYIIGGKRFIIYKLTLDTKPTIIIDSELTGFMWVDSREMENFKITNEVKVAQAESKPSNLL